MKKGIVLALITAAISGFSIFFSKVFVSSIDPVVFTAEKNLLVGMILSFILFRSNNLQQELKKLTKNQWRLLGAISIIGGSIPFALFFTGLTMTSATTGALIHKTLFLWVAILAIIFLKEKINIKQSVGYALILGGVFWISGFQAFSIRGIGEQMIFAATLLWAFENIMSKYAVKTIAPTVVAWGRMMIGSLILLGFVIFQGKGSELTVFNPQTITATLIGAGFLTGYVLTWYHAIKYIPVSFATSLLSLSPILTALLSHGLLQTPLATSDLITMLFIILGSAILIFLKSTPSRVGAR